MYGPENKGFKVKGCNYFLFWTLTLEIRSVGVGGGWGGVHFGALSAEVLSCFLILELCSPKGISLNGCFSLIKVILTIIFKVLIYLIDVKCPLNVTFKLTFNAIL